MVLIQRCISITEVAHGAAYSGHYRQVVLIKRYIIVSLRWPMERPTVVTIDRWTLYRGAIVLPELFTDRPTVVTIDRWSFYTSGLSTGLTAQQAIQ